uniref:Peptidase C1A papain C-terminal domain-containing protein n=1 Tax=Mucochytrium quahogii TaxID=96639 RepID=A0A7S2WQR0_9STRA|mmetsp:Transcript_13102/g.21219  ORF Transcript_13102/g.21219 Transcript_13102/m.21219 type:complete len:497 (-) Transcript_13102:7-1497(-)
MKFSTTILLLAAQVTVASSSRHEYLDKGKMNDRFFVKFVGTAAYDPRAGKKNGGGRRYPYGRVGPVERQNGPRCFESATDSAVAMQAFYAGVTKQPMLFSKAPVFNCGRKFLNPRAGSGNGDRCAVESYIRWGAWARNPDQVRNNWPELIGFCGRDNRKAHATKLVLERCGINNETVNRDEDLCQIRNYDIPRSLAGKCKAKIGNWARLTPILNGVPKHLRSGTCKVCAVPNGPNWKTSGAFGGTEAQCRKSVRRLAARGVSTTDYCSCKKMTNNYTSWRIPQTIKKGELLGGCQVDLRKLYADRIEMMQNKYGFPKPSRSFPERGSISNMLIARAITELGGVYSLVDAHKLTSNLDNLGTRCSHSHNHLVLVVGFNHTAKPPYWIIKNSRGTKYGDKGYHYLPLGKKCSGGGEAGWLSAVNKPFFPFWQFKHDKRYAKVLKGALMCDKYGTRASKKRRYRGGNNYKIDYCSKRVRNIKQHKLPKLFQYDPLNPSK